jgi:hypothetical protein
LTATDASVWIVPAASLDFGDLQQSGHDSDVIKRIDHGKAISPFHNPREYRVIIDSWTSIEGIEQLP